MKINLEIFSHTLEMGVKQHVNAMTPSTSSDKMSWSIHFITFITSITLKALYLWNYTQKQLCTM